MSQNILKDYDEIIRLSNELKLKQDMLLEKFEKFFEKNDVKINDIRLYSSLIEIKTNYARLDSKLIIKFVEEFNEFDTICIDSRDNLLYLIIRLDSKEHTGDS